jgi:hypothetical protein
MPSNPISYNPIVQTEAPDQGASSAVINSEIPESQVGDATMSSLCVYDYGYVPETLSEVVDNYRNQGTVIAGIDAHSINPFSYQPPPVSIGDIWDMHSVSRTATQGERTRAAVDEMADIVRNFMKEESS